MDPYDVDFAALRVLRVVAAQGSFTRAAEALGLSQSAVSYTIDRLRQAFGDPLFVRQGAGIVATERCDEIVQEAGLLLDRFAALSAPRGFDPAEARAEVVLACNYYERVTLLPPLVRLLRRAAPGLVLRVVTSNVRGREQLSRAEADLLIGPIRPDGSGFFARALMQDHYVCVMDAANPLASGPLGAERFATAPQAMVNHGASWRPAWLIQMETAGHAPVQVIEVPSHANLPHILSGTDLVAAVPARIAAQFGPGLVTRACPFRGDFAIELYWTARTHTSVMQRWLRSQIAQVAAGL